MKITTFKQIEHKPLSITSICSNNENLVVFRRDGTMELVNNETFITYLYYEIGFIVLESYFIKKYLVLLRTECGKVVFLNIESLEYETLDVGYKITNLAVKNKRKGKMNEDPGLCNGERSSYHIIICTTNNGFIYEIEGKNHKIIHKTTEEITSCMVTVDNKILYGNQKGKLYVLDTDGSEISEIQIDQEKVNKICYIGGERYVCICGSGYIHYIDIELLNIIQSVEVRQTPLNVCLFFDDKLHLSGVDSRVICYKLHDNVFHKSYQADKHFSEVLAMVCDNGRVITGGIDGMLSIFYPQEEKYSSGRVFESMVNGHYDISKQSIIVNNISFLEVFKLHSQKNGEENESTMNEKYFYNEFEYKPSIALEKKYFKSLNIRDVEYRNLLRFYFEKKVYYLNSDPAQTIIVFSDKSKTRLLNIRDILKTHVDEFFNMPSSKHILISETDIILQSLDYNIYILKQSDFSDMKIVNYSNFKEKIFYFRGFLILSWSKRVINLLTMMCKDMNVKGSIIDITNHQEKMVILSLTSGYDMYRKYSFAYYDPIDNVFTEFKELTTHLFIFSLVSSNDNLFYISQSSICNVNRSKRVYKIGSIIYLCTGTKNGLIVLKDEWSCIKYKLDKGVFKKKYFIK